MEKVGSLSFHKFLAADNTTADVHPQCMCTLLVYGYPGWKEEPQVASAKNEP